MRRIDELADIDLYDAEGVFKYLSELNGILRSLTTEVEYSSAALQTALGTVGGILGGLDLEARMRARRTTAPLRRVTDATQFCAVQTVKCGHLFRQNYDEELNKSGRHGKPAKTFNF